MKGHTPSPLFPKVMVPVIAGYPYQSALSAARAMAGEGLIQFAGLIPVPPEASLSTAAGKARELRATLESLSRDGRHYRFEKVHVTHEPWAELQEDRRRGPPKPVAAGMAGTIRRAAGHRCRAIQRPALQHRRSQREDLRSPRTGAGAAARWAVRRAFPALLAISGSILPRRSITSLHMSSAEGQRRHDAALSRIGARPGEPA